MSEDFFGVVGTSVASSPVSQHDDYGPDYSEYSPPKVGSSAEVSCWGQMDAAFYGVNKAHEKIPAGFYRCAHRPDISFHLLRHNLSLDKLMNLPDSASEEIVEEIRRFRGRKGKFEALGFLHKRGVLLWGPAGSGKTSTVMLLCDLIVKNEGGVAVYGDEPEMTSRCLQLVRRIERERPVILVLEEIDALVEKHGVSSYLSLLDGEAQIDNIVTVATTNYPERLDPTLTNRPGRFASIRYIGMPSRAAREAYILAKCPQLANGNLDAYLEASEGLSIDHLREIIVLTQCDDVPLEEAANRMKAMKVARPSSSRTPELPTSGF